MVQTDPLLQVRDTLQHIQGLVPSEVTPTNRRHPLAGERVMARRAYRWRGGVWLLLLHPDGDSARVRVEETDLLGRPTMEPDLPGVVLSLAGIRRLREMLARHKSAALDLPPLRPGRAERP